MIIQQSSIWKCGGPALAALALSLFAAAGWAQHSMVKPADDPRKP